MSSPEPSNCAGNDCACCSALAAKTAGSGAPGWRSQAPPDRSRPGKRPSARSERPNSRGDQRDASSSLERSDTTPAPDPPAGRNVSAQPDSGPRSHTPFGATGAADPGGRPAVRPTHVPTRRTVAGRRIATRSTHVDQHRPNPVPRRPVRLPDDPPHAPSATPSAVPEPKATARSLETTWDVQRVRSSQPRCASRGPNRNGGRFVALTIHGPGPTSRRSE